LSIRQSDHKATVHRVHVSLLEDDKSGIGELHYYPCHDPKSPRLCTEVLSHAGHLGIPMAGSSW
jgi:hypothetical protein